MQSQSAVKPIVLVRPHYINDPKNRDRPMMSLGILCIAGALVRAGYTVNLIDAPSDEHYMEKINTLVPGSLFVGLTVMTSQIPDAMNICERIKQIAPAVPIVWGGVHPSLFPIQTCNGTHCDVVVIGEGDETIVLLADAFSQNVPLDTIRGIVYREQTGKQHKTPPAASISNLDLLPSPAYELLTKEQITHLGNTTELAIGTSISIHAGRGCPYRCSFCINTVDAQTKRRHRTRSADAILDDIERLQQEYGIQTFIIQDEDFFADRKRLNEFLNGIRERRLRFYWQTSARANYFGSHYIDDTLLNEMTALGLIVLGVGAESGSDRTLMLLKKDITVQQIRNAVNISRLKPFRLVLSYMIGIPGETHHDMLKTLREMAWIHRHSDNVYLGGPYPFRPYPGSELFTTLTARNIKLPDTLSEWVTHAHSVEGFLDVKSLPWVADASLVLYWAQLIPFLYVSSTTPKRSIRSMVKRALVSVLQSAFTFRLAHDFWLFRFEIRMIRIFQKLRQLKKVY